MLGQCTSRIRDTLENDAGRKERLKLGAGLARYWSPQHVSHSPATCRSAYQTKLETAPGFRRYSPLLLLTHVRTQKISVGMGITGSLPLWDVTHSMNVLLYFSLLCV